MSTFPLLDPASEEALHRVRTFNTDEKALKRVTARFLGPESLLTTNGHIPAQKRRTDKNAKDAPGEDDDLSRNAQEELLHMRDDMNLEFANFESSLIRLQLLLNSNDMERRRYASEKVNIQSIAQDVQSNTVKLRIQLEEAQKQLALRKEYDELAEKITSNRLLKPREDQLANLHKLHSEIAELERESKEYAATWAERREQFGKIIEEGMQLRRLIRDEKEEVERREGMEGRDEHDDGDVASTRGRSNVGTPRPDAGGATPLHPGSDGDSNTLAPDRYSTRGKSPFRVSTPIAEEGTPRPPGTDMDDQLDEGAVSVHDAPSSPSEGLVAEEDEEQADQVSSDDDRSVEAMDTA